MALHNKPRLAWLSPCMLEESTQPSIFMQTMLTQVGLTLAQIQSTSLMFIVSALA